MLNWTTFSTSYSDDITLLLVWVLLICLFFLAVDFVTWLVGRFTRG